MMSYTYLHTGVYTCKFVSIALKIIDQSTWWRHRLHHSRGSFPKNQALATCWKRSVNPQVHHSLWPRVVPVTPLQSPRRMQILARSPLGMTWNMSLCLQNPTFHIRRMIGRESGRSAWWGWVPRVVVLWFHSTMDAGHRAVPTGCPERFLCQPKEFGFTPFCRWKSKVLRIRFSKAEPQPAICRCGVCGKFRVSIAWKPWSGMYV